MVTDEAKDRLPVWGRRGARPFRGRAPAGDVRGMGAYPLSWASIVRLGAAVVEAREAGAR